MDWGSALATVAGGMAKGFGEGRMVDIKSERDEIHRQVEREFQAGERAKDRDLTTTENQKTRDLTVSEGQKGRDLTTSENALNRDLTKSEGAAGRAQQLTLSQMQIAATKSEGALTRQHQTDQTRLASDLAAQRETLARWEQHGYSVAMLKDKADIDIAALSKHVDKVEVGADGFYVLFMKDGSVRKTEVKGVAKGETGAPVKIFDPNSPTGESYVPPSQATGKPAPPAAGLSLEIDGKGGVSLTQGKPGAGGLTTKTKSDIEEKQFNTAEKAARLDAMQAGFKPEWLQLKPRGKAAWSSMKDFMGVDLSQTEADNLTEITKFRQDTTKNLNQEIKDITGSAMGVQEAERIMSTMPNSGTGIFDGDSPTVYKAKLDNAIEQTRNAMIRYSYAKHNGLDPLKTGIELKDVPAKVEARGAEIEAEIKANNPGSAPSAIKLATRERLRLEFGIK